MLAFYGWTDTLLLNLVNTKKSYFKDEPADLFVLNLTRVSPELVQLVRDSGVFEHVFIVDRPDFQVDKGSRLTLFEKAVKLFSGGRCRKYYFKTLERLAGSVAYRILFTGAFWSDTLFLFWYFKKANPDIVIELVEEGMSSYNSPKGWQFRCIPKLGIDEWLMRLFYFGAVWVSARRTVERTYLYTNKVALHERCLNIALLPPITRENDICYRIMQGLSTSVDDTQYRRRALYCIIGSPVSGYEDDYEPFAEILRAVLQVISAEQVLVKAHPSVINSFEGSRFSDLLFIDRRRFFFESLCLKLDIEEKILMVRNSAIPLTLKCMLGKEPYIIFTHRLYPYYSFNGEPTTDEYAETLKRLYRKPEKVLVPDTVTELQNMIRKIQGTNVLRGTD